ncbi:DUF6924 domain-containing protein [Streptomyces brasiliensis]|uniref:DUF6924 domain-containing protein n=1 Tax=Streptomyces brasiliensis TaxID=1954 RepID=A0A917KV04_9ACTN|nr:hypothetical protein [Streptomyces brasiliensis]GGJ29271.1 hypothetical protein GCM10010121_045670 [Streptomyces brasiliensis]
MTSLPQTDATLLIRTDFSDEAAWQALRTVVTTPTEEDEFLADLHIVDDPAYRDLTTEQVLALAPAEDDLLIVADHKALTGPEMPLLAVMRADQESNDTEQGFDELRVIAMQLFSIENNITLANMDWESSWTPPSRTASSGDSDPVLATRGPVRLSVCEGPGGGPGPRRTLYQRGRRQTRRSQSAHAPWPTSSHGPHVWAVDAGNCADSNDTGVRGAGRFGSTPRPCVSCCRDSWRRNQQGSPCRPPRIAVRRRHACSAGRCSGGSW